MAFLAPVFLFLAALAGVPLLVHLLRRRVGRVFDFPAVRYLLRMEQEHSRERKLRNRLLLFLRMLAVIALALAAARPVARLAGVGHAPVAMALVIDNSMSSGAVRDGRAVLDELRADARSLLQSLTADDRAWIVTADGRVIGGSLAALDDALARLKPLGGRGDLAAATRRAVTLVRSGAPRAPVVAPGQRRAGDRVVGCRRRQRRPARHRGRRRAGAAVDARAARDPQRGRGGCARGAGAMDTDRATCHSPCSRRIPPPGASRSTDAPSRVAPRLRRRRTRRRASPSAGQRRHGVGARQRGARRRRTAWRRRALVRRARRAAADRRDARGSGPVPGRGARHARRGEAPRARDPRVPAPS